MLTCSFFFFSTYFQSCLHQNIFHTLLWEVGGSLVVQMVKSLPALWETQVRPLGQKDPLEKKMATHFSILAWKIPWTEEPGRLQSMGSQRVGHRRLRDFSSLLWEFILHICNTARFSCHSLHSILGSLTSLNFCLYILKFTSCGERFYEFWQVHSNMCLTL